MNHYQDINDGLDEYNEAAQQKLDQALWLQQPRYFDWLAAIGHFTAEKVHEVTLSGVKVNGRDHHPFSYWSGSATVTGVFEGSRSKLRIQWDNNGDYLDVRRYPSGESV